MQQPNNSQFSQDLDIFITSLYPPNQTSQACDWHRVLATLTILSGADFAKFDYVGSINQISIEYGLASTSTKNWQQMSSSEEGFCLQLSSNKQDALQLWLEQYSKSINQLIKMKLLQMEANSYQQATTFCVETLQLAALHIKPDSSLVFANPVAYKLISAGCLKQRHQKIHLNEDSGWIEQQINNKTLGSSYISFPCQTGILHCVLVPLTSNIASEVGLETEYLLLCCNKSLIISPASLADLLDIKPAHASIACKFILGIKAEQIAIETGFSVNTVYSYIRDLYTNFGINHQSQLSANILPNLP